MPVDPLTKSRLTEQRVQAGLPALAAASARRGGSVQVWVDGERSIGSGVAVKDSDVWHLGSISKPMTATLVARLVDLGAVCWDDCVGEVLSIVAPAMNECYRSATFRHLLSHRSGLPANIPAEHIEPLIMIDCPFVLFPFARRVIADGTRDGGFPPLMLDPIDFHALYIQNREKAA